MNFYFDRIRSKGYDMNIFSPHCCEMKLCTVQDNWKLHYPLTCYLQQFELTFQWWTFVSTLNCKSNFSVINSTNVIYSLKQFNVYEIEYKFNYYKCLNQQLLTLFYKIPHQHRIHPNHMFSTNLLEKMDFYHFKSATSNVISHF